MLRCAVLFCAVLHAAAFSSWVPEPSEVLCCAVQGALAHSTCHCGWLAGCGPKA